RSKKEASSELLSTGYSVTNGASSTNQPGSQLLFNDVRKFFHWENVALASRGFTLEDVQWPYSRTNSGLTYVIVPIAPVMKITSPDASTASRRRRSSSCDGDG